MATLALWCWVYGDNSNKIFEVNIPGTETIAALKEVIKNKKPVDFGHVDPDVLALYSIPIPDDDEQLEADLQQWKLSDASKPLPPRKPLSKLDLSGRVIIVRDPERCARFFLYSALLHPSCRRVAELSILTLSCWVHGDDTNHIFNVKIPSTEDVPALREAIKNQKPVDFGHVDPDALALYSIPMPDKENWKHVLLQSQQILKEEHLLDALETLSSLNLSHSLVVVFPRPKFTQSRAHPPLSSPTVGDLRSEYSRNNKPMAPSIAGVAKSFFARQEDERAKIDCNRPPGAMGTIPVTLLHPVFPRFLDDCETHEVTADDNAFALELSHTMSKFYEGENTRAEEIRRLFERWGVCFTVSTTDHGFTTDGDLDVNDHRYAIVEIKNEITSSGADPYNQGILYYLEWTRDTAKTLENTCLPCMLILLFGPYVAFVGAAWNLRPTAEILSFVLPMHFHPSNTSMRLNVARHLVAFKRAVHTLGAYYQEITSVDISCPPQPQMFPYHTHFNYLEGGDTPQQGFEYTSQPIEDKLVFFATLPDMWEVCIKFVRHYSKDAHEACASLGCAPKLHAFETLPGGWFMVVMDKLAPEEYTTLWEVTPTKQSFDSIKNYLVQLHQKGYVHGDVRDTNIMVSKRDGTCMLVDFDWAGKIGDVQYPVNVSRDGIWRPSGAVDWQLILAEHDMAMLDHIHRRHGKNSVEMIRAESLDNSSS